MVFLVGRVRRSSLRLQERGEARGPCPSQPLPLCPAIGSFGLCRCALFCGGALGGRAKNRSWSTLRSFLRPFLANLVLRSGLVQGRILTNLSFSGDV